MLRRPIFFTLLATLTCFSLRAGPIPPELDRALKLFRAEGGPGWAFVQTTESNGKSLVEHYNPAKPEFARWTLLKKNGAAPTASDTKEYQQRLSRRTSGGTAPNVKDQIDPTTCERVSDDSERTSYRFRLRPGDKGDRSAAHMAACFTLHKPTGAIERVELASLESFSPVVAVNITEAKTIMMYSLPTGDRPALLQQISVHIRGRAMWIKSLDEDMDVTYSEQEFVGKKPAAPTSTTENPARSAAGAP
jgi:hypothetical protein